jgi:hypothetical protein
MNPFHLHIPYTLIIAILCGIIFLQREFGGAHVTNNTTNELKYDSAQREVSVKYIHGPVQTIEEPVPAIVDTMAILRAYFEKNVYKQVLGDSLMSAEITAVIFKNKLDSLGFKYKILRPTAITTIQEQKLKVFAGITTGANKTSLAFGPEVAVLTKKDHLYTANYDALSKSVNVSALWKIQVKRKSLLK